MAETSRPRYPREATPGERRAAVDERRTRAVEEPLDVRLRSSDVYPVLEVRNPLHGTAYRVLLPEFPSASSALCTCTDFARRGLGTCKHIEAGYRWFGEHPDAVPLLPRGRGEPRTTGVWREVDRRLAHRARDPAPESLRWRRPGDVLFERWRKEE
ncbi:MAG: hypothetical protein ABSB97_00895 [Thermoplasmata archaeon]|jgi:hypothetical protein